MKPYIVGVDGSVASVNALSWAGELARATGATVIAVNAFIPELSEIRPTTAARLQQEQTELLAGWCGRHLEGVDHQLVVLNGDPRDVLTAAVHDHDPDLLVVASVGKARRTPGFLHIGSVVEYLAHHLDHPMAVVPPDAPANVDHIAVAVDGSPDSRSAVEWTTRLAKATGASVVAVAVKEADQPISEDDDETAWQQAATQVVTSDWAQPLPVELGERFRAVVTSDLPVPDTILATAAHEGSDLVVVGARGVGGVTGLRIGGVALGTLHRAEVPVVLVPRPQS